MDAARIAAIWTELKEYGAETQLGFPLSTIKVGEACQLISDLAVLADTIERLQKERDQLEAGGKVWQRTAGHLKQERDAALAEVERLQKERDDLNTENLRVIERNLELVAEVERLMGALVTVAGRPKTTPFYIIAESLNDPDWLEKAREYL